MQSEISFYLEYIKLGLFTQQQQQVSWHTSYLVVYDEIWEQVCALPGQQKSI